MRREERFVVSTFQTEAVSAPKSENHLVSATQYVRYGDRGFWTYDIILGVFLKYLIDVVEATGFSRTSFLDETVRHWRLAPIANFRLHLEKSWTALQRQNVIDFAKEACARLATRESIPMQEILGWPFFDGLHLFHRGLKEVRTGPVIELGGAFIDLLSDTLPEAPKGEAWFFTDTGRSTIGMRPDSQNPSSQGQAGQ